MASHSAVSFELGEGEDDYLQQGSESYATNHRHLQELHRLCRKVVHWWFHGASYDGRGSWFAYEDAIDDWCDITELDNDKRGPALRNRLGGEAAIHKRLLVRERLKDPNNGVKYFKSFLRPLFVKGAANVFLYRFQQFMNLHRGNRDMLRWITRFQLSIQRMQEAWNDTYLPIVDVNNAEVRAFITGLPAEEQATITPEEAMERANDRLREQHARTIPITANLLPAEEQATITPEEAMERANDRLREQHARTIPITANLVALIFVSLSDLTQDQRQVFTECTSRRKLRFASIQLRQACLTLIQYPRFLKNTAMPPCRTLD
eukprot:s1004_g21.t1